jgi:hypothetical protein
MTIGVLDEPPKLAVLITEDRGRAEAGAAPDPGKIVPTFQ